MKQFNLIALIAALGATCTSCCALTPLAKVTLRVVDEGGMQIPGASAMVGFNYGGTWTDPGKFVGREGLTDTNGYFTASGRTDGIAGYGAKQTGYYETLMQYTFREPKLGRWQPWNPELKVVLKKIGQPTAMYAKRVETYIPKLDEPVGYDLTIGDWVAPFGKGLQSDFVFRVTKDVKRWEDHEGTIELSFSNKGDGLQPFKPAETNYSELTIPGVAPELGYVNKWSKTRIVKGTKRVNVQADGHLNFYFRVRTVGLEDGIQRSWYGKIHGEPEFDVHTSKTAFIRFTYYLNPDGTRNVEFDPTKNLLRNLTWLENVTKTLGDLTCSGRPRALAYSFVRFARKSD